MLRTLRRSLVRTLPVNWALKRVSKLSVFRQEWRKRLPIVGTITVSYLPGRPLRLKTTEGEWVGKSLHWDGLSAYEPETTTVFLRLLADADCVLDIGANVGIFALLAGLENPRRKVHAFEPVPAIYDRLQENIRLNKAKNVTAHAIALSDFDGVSTLHVPPGEMPTEASLRAGFRKETVSVEVETLTLDTFVEKHQIGRVDLMKIDTEATEHKVLAGARELLRRDRPTMICEVLAGITERHLHALLDGTGYRYFWMTEDGLVEKQQIAGDPTYRNFNYLFIPEEKLGAITPRAPASVA